MIRAASHSDLPRLRDLLLEMQRVSKFYPDIDVDQPTARSILLTGVQRHGGLTLGGANVQVVEKNGQVEAFMLGMLDRVYHIGNRLQANDIYLYATQAAPKTAAVQLLKGYIAWALGNPKVAKIMLSWTDALGVDGEKLARVYEKLGFHRVGEIWEREGS
jgi:hypothetical protein